MNTGESTTRSFPGTSQSPAAAAPVAGEVTIELSASQLTPTVAAPAPRHLTRLQWIVALSMTGLLLLAAARLAAIEGWLRRVSIDGPSMAPAYFGAHYRVTCDDCRFPFRCDAAEVPASGEVVCPNCGYRRNKLLATDLQPGEPVLIDRWPLMAGAPERGDVVAASQPGSENELVVKRVAGLPGERLEIKGGDLYVGDKIIRKKLPQLHEVRVLVHDNDFQPAKTGGLPQRWQPGSDSPPWKADGTGFRREMAKTPIRGPENALWWLHYHHWHASAGLTPRTKEVPIFDNDSFNQNLPRQLHPVTDIALACQIRAAGSGRFVLAVTDGARRFEALCEPEKQHVVVQLDDKPIAERDLAADFERSTVAVEFGLCDQQVFLTVAGREVVREPYEPSTDSHPARLHTLEIGAGWALDIEVSHLQVWRDIYYLEPLGTARPWQAEQPLAADEFALLGDNPPVSTDSRHWPESGGVRRGTILGRVVRPFWAASPL